MNCRTACEPPKSHANSSHGRVGLLQWRYISQMFPHELKPMGGHLQHAEQLPSKGPRFMAAKELGVSKLWHWVEVFV